MSSTLTPASMTDTEEHGNSSKEGVGEVELGQADMNKSRGRSEKHDDEGSPAPQEAASNEPEKDSSSSSDQQAVPQSSNNNNANTETKKSARPSSIYNDAIDACQFAMWTYLLADMREMEEKGQLNDPEQTLSFLPLSFSDIWKLFQSNYSAFEKRLTSAKKDLYFTAAQDWMQRDDMASLVGGSPQTKSNSKAVLGTYCAVFDDDNRDSQCVYSVSVSPSMKSIIVSFRGSVTPKDWMMDVQAAIRDIPNPVYEMEEGQPEMVGIHHGFQEYLYGHNEKKETLKPSNGRKNNKKRRQAIDNKIQNVLHQAAVLLEEHPGFKLVSTGHSLGGALATVFAFEAAASEDPRICKPVKLITVASPKVGNLPFRLAIECLERKGMIRILRVANYKDAVCVSPDFALNLHQQSYLRASYRHVGPKLMLLPKYRGGYRIRLARSEGKSIRYLRFLDCYNDARHCCMVATAMPVFCVCSCKVGSDVYQAHGNAMYIKLSMTVRMRYRK